MGERPAGGGEYDGAVRVDVIESEAPPQQACGVAHLDLGGWHDVEVAQHRHTPGVDVEAAGVRSLDGLVHASGSALEHLAVFVDQGVVGDVAPAQLAGVVLVDRPDDAAESSGA